MCWLTCLISILVFGSMATAADKTPRIVECTADALILRLTCERVTWDQLQQPGNSFEKLLDGIATNKTEQFLALLVRPGSRPFFRIARKTAMDRSVDVGYDVDEPVGSAKPNSPRFGFPPEDHAGDKKPLYFECRSNQVFFVDREGLEKQILPHWNQGSRGVHPAVLPKLFSTIAIEITNTYYNVLPNYLLALILALELKPGVNGDDTEQLKHHDCLYRKVLSKFNAHNYYIDFLVRDDGFAVFRQARLIAEDNRFETGWVPMSDDVIKWAYAADPVY